METVTLRTNAGLMIASEIIRHSTELDFTEGVEPFPDEARVKPSGRMTPPQAIKLQVRKLDLDVDAVRVQTVVGHFDSGIVSGHKSSEARACATHN